MGIIDTANDAYELVKKGATVELQERIMQLREEALALQEENLQLKARVKELEGTFKERQKLEWDGKVYWQILPDGGKDGPYCQHCYDSNAKLVQLRPHMPRTGIGRQYFVCPTCKQTYSR